MHDTQRWAVVGGGMLGMTLALRLAQRGHSVTLHESANRLGGLASVWELGGITWDKHYHVILNSDKHLLDLLDELGLSDQLQWKQTRTGFYTDGRLHSLSNSWEFLRFPPLGLWSKLRLATTIHYASKIRDWRRLERISAIAWLQRWSGRRTFAKIWRPLLRAKLGDNYTKASAAFIWAIIARMYSARRTQLKREQMGYVQGGYAQILERLGKALSQHGVDIRLNQTLQMVSGEEGSFALQFADGSQSTADRVVITLPATAAAGVCPDLSSDEQKRLRGVAYQGIVCASLLLRKPLADFYVTNLTDEWVPFTAIVEMSALVDRAAFGGHALVYLPKYVDPGDAIFDESDASIRDRFVRALEKIYPHFDSENVLAFRLSRVRRMLPIPTLGYSERLPSMRTSVPGLFLVNSAHIVNGTLNVNETVQLAGRALPMLLAGVKPVPILAEV